MPENDQIVEFEGGGLDPGTFEVRSMEGFEEISGLYRFRLDLWSHDKKVKIEDMLSKAARIGLYRHVTTSDGKPATALYNIYGMPSSFEQLELRDEQAHYTVEIVPRFWRLTRTSQSRILQKVSVPDIVKNTLSDNKTYAMKSGDDFDIKVATTHADREFTVQYQETDFAFLSRLLEHEGIFYLFSQEEDREKLIFADGNTAFEPIVGAAALKYKPQGQIVAADGAKAREEEIVSAWVCRQSEGPEKVQLADWNHRDPEVSLVVEEPVDPNGKGKVYEYGNHYKTQSEGKALAKVRAEAILCRLKQFEGTSNCRRFKAGAKFTLEGHYRDDFNGEYLIVSVHHRVIQQGGRSSGGHSSYENSFVCIPAAVVFRPERRTPLPKIQGLMPGLVHAPDGAESPEVDDNGSYRVKFLFDIDEPKDASAPPSRPIRMAQASSGPDHGFHAPLRGETEAVVAFSDGNPDRPLILSSVPNPKNGSPVKGANKSQQIWKGQANNQIIFEEKKDNEKIYIYAQKDFHLRTKNDRVEWVGHDSHLHVVEHLNEKVEGDHSLKLGGNEMVEITGDSNLTVTGKTIHTHSDTVSIKYSKDVAVKHDAGHAVDCGSDFYVKAKNIILEGSSSITLTAGGSEVIISGSGVTVKSSAVTIDSNSIKMAMGPGGSATAGTAGSVSDPTPPKEALDADEPTAPGSGGGGGGSGGGGGAVPVPINPPKPYKPDPAKTHWVEIELVDQEGNPLPGKRYTIKTPDNQLAESYTDEQGKARLEGIDSGSCEISFPELDEHDVEPA